jgi:flagellar basal body-associated protein FliL
VALAKKKAWLWIIASVLAVLLLGGLVFLLFRAMTQSKAAAEVLESGRGRLVNFYDRDPFPSHTNVVVEKSNAALMRQWREDLLRTLSANQVAAPGKTPAQFEIFLTAKSKELRDSAARNGVRLPAGFSFGFARYADGRALPEAREDLPTHLAEQLVIVEHICRLLFDSKVSELVSVVRDEFPIERGESFGAPVSPGTPAGSGGPGRLKRLQQAPAAAQPAAAGEKAPAAPSYRKLHFIFELRAGEPVVVDVLNRLAADPVFIVVTSVEVETVADLQLGAQPKREDVTNATARVTAKVVCGPELTEPAQVKIDLDVYRF